MFLFSPSLLTTTWLVVALSILTRTTFATPLKAINHHIDLSSPLLQHESGKGLPHLARPFPPVTPPPTTQPPPSKRARIGDLPPEFRTFALEHGWSITVSTVSALVPLASDLGVRNARATRALGALFSQVQAMCAANMLNNSPWKPQVAFRFGKTELLFEMHARSLVQEISWSFVFNFAAYMLVWVENGFAGSFAPFSFTHQKMQMSHRTYLA
ncbi:MAG: hypothetical protein Q9185_003842 [Variospora sp. 1 TL-2023]